MKDPIQDIVEVSKLLQLERDYEIKQFDENLVKKSIQERKEAGNTWYPLSLKEKAFTLGAMPLLKLTRNPGDRQAHNFYPGSPILLFNSESDTTTNGHIHKISEEEASIVIYHEDFPEGMDDGKLGFNLAFDSKSFLEMERVLKELMTIERGRLKDLRDCILGYKEAEFEDKFAFELPNLNPSQNRALSNAISAKDLSIIHGPPGTGKTTTIVEITKQLIKKESNILVCAPSNAAVDHLARKLNEAGLKVLRIGNLSKIDETVNALTLEQKMSAEKDYKRIQDYKRSAIELREKASKYKRNFGAKEREERKHAYREARDFLELSKELEKYLLDKIIHESNVICTTLIGSASRDLKDYHFETVIIDEAAQALEPATWVPIRKANKVILVGDPLQLPPTVKNREAESAGLDITLIEKSMERTENSSLLTEQYRMNSEIMAFSNQWFYHNQLIANKNVAKWNIEDGKTVVEFIDIAGCGFEEDAETGNSSKFNIGEVEIVTKRIEEFEDLEKHSLGVISPYKQQVQLLREAIPKLENISVNTVDSFQGQEMDVIIISLVRSNPDGVIGFLKDYRRMNVAMTRAKKKLIIVGDSATIGQDKFYEAFLNFCESNNYYRSAWEYMYE